MAIREAKSEYVAARHAARQPAAKLLKLADRISNITALGYVHDVEFVRRYLSGDARVVSCRMPSRSTPACSGGCRMI